MAQRTRHPEDAHRGAVAPTPADAHEAAADRELADAERALVLGTATREQRTRVEATGDARSHEERRERWMSSDGSEGRGADRQ